MVFYALGEAGSMHNGPRHAGNKSAMSFRTGHAVSGYTGYCPSNEAIPIPTKNGPNEAPPELLRDTRTAQPSLVLDIDMRVNTGVLGESEYRRRFNETSKAVMQDVERIKTAKSQQDADHAHNNFVTAGHHDSLATTSNSVQEFNSVEMEMSSMLAPKLFLGQSTYRTAHTHPAHRQFRYVVLEGKTSAGDLTGVRKYDQVANRREPDNLRTSYRALHENPQLRTYGHHWLVDKDVASSATHTIPSAYPNVAGAPQTAFEPHIDAFQAGPKDFDSMYTQAHGHMNKPQHKLNVSMQLYDKLQLSAHADTHELFHGTPKYFSARVPGYSGTLAETAHAHGQHKSALTANAVLQSQDHRNTETKNFGPFLSQTFSYHIPGYLGVRPQNACNSKVDPIKSFGFAGRPGTTTEDFNVQVGNPEALMKTREMNRTTTLRHPVRGTLIKNFGNSSETVKFFTPGVETESANGRANAETFYKQQRPLEGVPRRHQPSASTVNGYVFDCYTSRIN